MSKPLEMIRVLRNTVIGERCSSEPSKKIGRLARKISAKKKRRVQEGQYERLNEPDSRLPYQSTPGFDAWMGTVKEAILEFTGMDLDIFPVLPWEDWFKQGMSAIKAAKYAITKAEEEDDTFDSSKYIDEDEEDLDEEEEDPVEESVRSSLRNKSSKLTRLAQLLDEYDFNSSAGEDDENQEDEEFVEEEPDAKSGGRLGGDVASVLRAITEDEKRAKSVRDKPKEMKLPLNTDVNIVKVAKSIQERDDYEKSHFSKEVMSEVNEAIAAVKKDKVVQNRLPLSDKNIVDPKQFSPVLNEQVGLDSSQSNSVDEASVDGGDYGRFGPATAAAKRSGYALAAVISKKEGTRYKMHDSGAVHSETGGAALWFLMQPDDKEKPNYFLGLQARNDSKGEEDRRWNILVKKGKTLGDTTSVASENDVSSGDLSRTIGKMKGKVKGS